MALVLQNFLPLAGQPSGTDLVLEGEGNRLIVLDKNDNPKTKKSLVPFAFTKGSKEIAGLHQWIPVGDDIVAFADLHGPGPEAWEAALIRFPLVNPGSFKVLQNTSMAPTDDERTFYRAGAPYIAAIGNTVYILRMSRTIGLFKNERNSSALVSLGAYPTTQSPLNVPHPLDSQKFVDMMEAIEHSTMPVGLFAWENSLYVLQRSPRSPSSSGTRWTMASVSPENGEITGVAELPIHADHVTVIPGPEKWAFLEKGPVEAFGLQDIPRVLFVPARFFKTPLHGNLCN
jgi:hypothetical protein